MELEPRGSAVRRGLLIVAALVIRTQELWANPIESFGFDPVDQGRAGASVASGDLLSAASTNIAAAAMRGRRFAIEVGWTYHHLALEIDGQKAQGTSDAHGMLIGVGLPFPYGPLEVGAAASLWIPDQYLYRETLTPPGQQRFLMWENRPHRMDFHIGLGVRLFRVVHLGAALGLSAEWDVDVTYRSMGTTSGASVSAHVPYRAQPQLSALVTPMEGLSIGLRFNFTVGQNYRLDFYSDSAALGGSGDILLQLRGTDYWSPTQLCLGANAKLSPNIRATAEGEWQHWSEAVPPTALVTYAAHSGDLVARTPDGLGPTGYHDVIILRTAVEGDVHFPHRTLTIRGGYAYIPSPIAHTGAGANLVDSDRHRFAIGASMELGEVFGLHFFVHTSLTWQHLLYISSEVASPVGPAGSVIIGGNTIGGALTLSAGF